MERERERERGKRSEEMLDNIIRIGKCMHFHNVKK